MEVITADNIYMTAPGSREVTCNQISDCTCVRNDNAELTSQYRNFSAYLHRFAMPGDETPGTYKNMWYSFDVGLVHFVVINTETDFDGAPSGPGTNLNGGDFATKHVQTNWFRDDLETARRTNSSTPWIVVLGHRPWLSGTGVIPSYSNPYTNCPMCYWAFQEIIWQYKVDFHFSGFANWYERLWPINAIGIPTQYDYNYPQGPIFITTGASGAPIEYPVGYIGAVASANHAKAYGYSKLEILDAEHAKFYFYNSSNLAVLDYILVTKNKNSAQEC